MRFPKAVPAAKPALTGPVHVLWRARVTSRAEVASLTGGLAPASAFPLPLGMAGTAVPSSEGIHVRAFLGVGMPDITCRPVKPCRLVLPVHGLGDRFQAGERVAAQDVQAPVQVIKHQPWRNWPAEVLPYHPVNSPVMAVMLLEGGEPS